MAAYCGAQTLEASGLALGNETRQLECLHFRLMICERIVPDVCAEISVSLVRCENRLKLLSVIQEQIDQEQIKLEQVASKRRACQQRLNEDEAKTKQVEEILADKAKVIKQKIQDALKLCPRVDNPRYSLTASVTQQELSDCCA